MLEKEKRREEEEAEGRAERMSCALDTQVLCWTQKYYQH